MVRCNQFGMKRRGFTLLELILALGLSVLVMSIIVGLIGLYSSNFTTRGEDIRRVALARAVLNMIADDLRSTVTKQEYDTKVLEQMLMGQGGGGGAGGQGGGASSGGNGSNNPSQPRPGVTDPTKPPTPGAPQTPSGGPGGRPDQSKANQPNSPSGGPAFGSTPGQSNQSGQSGQSGQSNTADSSADAAGADAAASTTTALPLGIYGSATNLTIDVSRIPRMDEYNAQQNGLLNGTLTDLPGDIKSVSYFVQMPSTIGVTDSMNQVTSTQSNANGVAGLVRRALDRAVMDNAESTGQSTQLQRTGELVAPEVLALEFSYYDGTQWTTTWDSSTQGLPWLVDISLAMQTKTGEKNGAVPPGISLTTMPYEERARYGIEVYTLMVTIPGAQLQSSGTATDSTGTGTGTDSGMSSVGL